MLIVDVLGPLAAGGDATASLSFGIISGITAIVVAYIGYLSTRHREQSITPAPPVPGSDNEPQWVVELRRDLAHERAINDNHEGEIERLQRLLYINKIDPTDGSKLGSR